LCVHEHGHLFLLTILNTIDDTVMLKKQILSAILENIKTIVVSEWGRKVIEWIVSPDDTFYFHPSLVQALNEASKFGKKDAAVRRAEILAGVETEICEA
jgi:pumilio homology domain family member 6